MNFRIMYNKIKFLYELHGKQGCGRKDVKYWRVI